MRILLRSGFCVLILSCLGWAQAAQPVSGQAVYQKRCASCHDSGGERIPTRTSLEQLPAARILKVLDFGVMMTVAYTMKRDEREAVANYLGKPGPEPGPPPQAWCKDRRVALSSAPKFFWNGWSPAGDNARFQPRAIAGLGLDQVPRLKLKWAYAFAGDISAFDQPTVIDGHVFVGSAGGTVQALRADSGCLEWTFEANGPVRSALVAAPVGKRHMLLFSDLNGWTYGVDAETGKQVWRKRLEDHEAARLTGASIMHDGVLYVGAASWEETRSLNPQYPCCTFRGSVSALRVADGSTVWKTYTIRDVPKETGKTAIGTPQIGPSGAGVWSTPTLDLKRGLLYVTTGDNYSQPATDTSDAVMAMDLKDGHIVWTRQTFPGDAYNSACGVKDKTNCPTDSGPDYDYGSSAILVKTEQGRELLLAGQKSGMVYALDPDRQGEIVWQQRVGKGGTIGGVQWGMASDGQNVYAAVSDAVFTTTPSERILDPKQGGGLTALRIADGSKVWYAAPEPCPPIPHCGPPQSAALTAIPGVVFSGSVDGHLRAYSAESGKVIWDVNTAHEYQTVNGVPGHGGSLDGPGAVIVNGMLFVNSGYARYGGMPGNVLLAFGVE